MQYLSKAYNYYSGINPATLSGAIDVIVVRHVDENGEVTLSSSPFHVRFGKLQVLRAGEKRVTLRMPNNLPPPHVAPFNMKVVDTGEAFFVLETSEEVPEELLTSPVVMPTDANSLPPTPPYHQDSNSSEPTTGAEPKTGSDGSGSHSGPNLASSQNGFITQQPFGETEQQVQHQSHNEEGTSEEPLPDVEPLDLNQPAEEGLPRSQKKSSTATSSPPSPVDSSATAASPSSILNTASSLLPSIPFLSSSSRSSSRSGSPPREVKPKDPSPERANTPPRRSSTPSAQTQAKETGHPVLSSTSQATNPAAAGPGESPGLLDRDDKLSDLTEDRKIKGGVDPSTNEDPLPKVTAGEGEGPDVVYGRDVVLDMAGYHSAGKATEEQVEGAEVGIQREETMIEERRKSSLLPKEHHKMGSGAVKVKDALVESFARDLLASIPSHSLDHGGPSRRPSLPPPRSTDSVIPLDDDDLDGDTSTVVPDGLNTHSTRDLPSSLASLSLETPDTPSPSKKNLTPSRQRGDRGVSEPPPDMEDDEETLSDRFPHPLAPPSPLSRPVNGQIFPYAQKGSPSPTTSLNYPPWDWARVPTQRLENGGVEDLKRSLDMERSASGPLTKSGHVSEELMRSDTMPPSGLDLATPSVRQIPRDPSSSAPGRLKNVEESPFLFILEMDEGVSYTFELSLCGSETFADGGDATNEEESAFLKNRVTFQKFVEDPELVDDPRLVLRYSLLYLTWTTGYNLLYALAMYRRSLTPPGYGQAVPRQLNANAQTQPSASTWGRWWRRGQGQNTGSQISSPAAPIASPTTVSGQIPAVVRTSPQSSVPQTPVAEKPKQYAKTLRLSSDQLKQLNLKSGPNTISFSVTSSYSGFATCTARIFLWDDSDQIVISDIDGTITKSDALGHVFAAIGRDWTHMGIAKLYTDICNNGYRILYLTSRAIGQADSTREYLKSIQQAEYRLPEGPVIMSPDRLMASLHREVIMRKPETFKMSCLRDIQRLFGSNSKESFFAGFGNRITDAMSYRSVGIDASKIYTIDSTGVVKTELLQAAGHKGSYLALNDLVNETFPPVGTKFKPEFTDFNWWRSTIADIPLPDLTPVPVSPALSARSASSTSSRYNVFGKISQTIGRKPSRQPLLPTTSDDRKSTFSRPSSPLVMPAITPDDLDWSDDEDLGRRSRESSMPGSFESRGEHFPEFMRDEHQRQRRAEEGRSKSGLNGHAKPDDQGADDSDDESLRNRGEGDSFDDDAIFDDDILATGEMKNVPF